MGKSRVVNAKIVLLFVLAAKLMARPPLDAANPTSYINWQNDDLYKSNYHNKDGHWDGKAVIVFVHGIRSNTALTWGAQPNINEVAINAGRTSLEKLLLQNYKGVDEFGCSEAALIFANDLSNKATLWAPLGNYYKQLCIQGARGPERYEWLEELFFGFCRIRAIHMKHPSGFYLHDNRTVTKVKYNCYMYANSGICCEDEPGKVCNKTSWNRISSTGEYTVSSGTVQINNEVEGAEINNVLSWVSSEYGRTDALDYYNGIEFVDFFDSRASIDATVRDGNPLPYPDWQLDTPYGWFGQLILQSVEILNKYWPNGTWQGNPSARLIFVCHSAGGIALRTALHYLNDPTFQNEFLNDLKKSSVFNQYYRRFFLSEKGTANIDIRGNVGKAITFCTPHNGGSGSFVNDLNEYFRKIDEVDALTISASPQLLKIKLYYETIRSVLDLYQSSGASLKCGEDEFELRAMEVIDDLATGSDCISRIRGEYPVNAVGEPIPFVCFEFDGDDWASHAKLSSALTPEQRIKYADHLLELRITALSGEDVHGRAVNAYVNKEIFRKAFEWGDTNPRDVYDRTPVSVNKNRAITHR